MTTPRPELLPEGSTLIEWKLTPEIYQKRSPDWRQWGPGPQDEPDRIEWRAPGSSLPRMALRGPLGAWCGYVGVPEGHPLHGRKAWGTGATDAQRSAAVDALDVHGGITYAEACAGNICHLPQPGESDHVWWFGFDCAHAWDVIPSMAARFPSFGAGDTYRDLAYIIAEVEGLATQLDASRAIADTRTPEDSPT